ncbi:alpha/beta hydrolase [Jatrophihabitans fulvus]
MTTHRLADGTVIALVDSGPRDAEVTVVLVPGWSQDHVSWEDVTALLRAQRPELRVIVPEARGHGRSDAGPRGSATIDQLAEDVVHVIGARAPHGDLVLAGHSLGGPILISLAARHPQLIERRVRGVALVATSGAGLGKDLFGLHGAVTAPAMRVTAAVAAVRALSRGRRNLRRPELIAWAIRAGFYGPGAGSARNRRRTAGQTSRAHPATTAQLVAEMMRFDRLAELTALNRPSTVVLAGTKDGLCPMAHSRALADAMPDAELIVYPNAGHMLPFERASEVADVLVRLADTPVPQKEK